MKKRGFERISFRQFEKDFNNFNDLKVMYDGLKIPKRSTMSSAGYDFYAPYDFILEPNEIIKVPTGIKAYMQTDEYMSLINRSSIGFKYNVRLCNQIGILDADYYNNENNEGNLWIAFQNEGQVSWKVKKGEKIAQGIFQKYLLIDDDEPVSMIRNGGLGSTGKGDEN